MQFNLFDLKSKMITALLHYCSYFYCPYKEKYWREELLGPFDPGKGLYKYIDLPFFKLWTEQAGLSLAGAWFVILFFQIE